MALALQAQTSTVFGMITHRNKQPATKVLVSIARKIAYTDDSGRYRIDGVPLGSQKMAISKEGAVLLQTEVAIKGKQQRLDKQIP